MVSSVIVGVVLGKHWLRDSTTHRKGVFVHITIVGCTHEDRGRVLNIFHIDGDSRGG